MESTPVMYLFSLGIDKRFKSDTNYFDRSAINLWDLSGDGGTEVR